MIQYGYRVNWTENRPTPHPFAGKLWIFDSKGDDPVGGMTADQVIDSGRAYRDSCAELLAPVAYDVHVVCEHRQTFHTDGVWTGSASWEPLAVLRDEPDAPCDVPPVAVIDELRERLAPIGRWSSSH